MKKFAASVLMGFVALAGMTFATSSIAEAALVFESDFSKAVDGRSIGGGVREVADGVLVSDREDREGGLLYRISSLGLGKQGTIEYWVKRINDNKVEEPVVTFPDSEGGNYAMSGLYWGEKDSGIIFHMDYYDGKQDHAVWGDVVRFGKPVAVGEWVHVILTWGADNKVYVDGRNVELKVADDQEINFSDIDRMYLGTDAHALEPGNNRFFAENTLIGGVALYDTAVSAEEAASIFASRQLTSKELDYPPNVENVVAVFENGAIKVSWDPLADIEGYNVYRRSNLADRFDLLTRPAQPGTTLIDSAVDEGETYFYSVYAVNGGLESRDSVEVSAIAAGLSVASVSSDARSYRAGGELVVTAVGSADMIATFSVEGLVADVEMTEVDDGVYVGNAVVPAGVDLAEASVSAIITDPATGRTVAGTGQAIAMDGIVPEQVSAIIADAGWGGQVEVSWNASASEDVEKYLVYRMKGGGTTIAGTPLDETTELFYVDSAVIGGTEYGYAIVAVDDAGNTSVASEVATVVAVAGEGPRVASVTVEPGAHPVRPGDTVKITVVGQEDATVTVDLGDIAPAMLLEEVSNGRYESTYQITDGDVQTETFRHNVVAHLKDDFGVTHRAGNELIVVGLADLNDHTPPVISGSSHDAWKVAGFSGKLVAGDVVTVSLEGEPEGFATFVIEGITGEIKMTENSAGDYSGSYTVGWNDEGDEVAVFAELADAGGNETKLQVGRTLAFDTRVRLNVEARDPLLPANKVSQTRIVVRAENANGDEVSGHELSLTLSTTEEYTGVVGGGELEGELASIEDEDDIEIKWGGVTDAFGEVAATYTAGFAAKTALIVAKDLTTGDVGAGWLNTYVASTVAIELFPRAQRGATDLAKLLLTAEPSRLTADGRSKSRIKAYLTDLSGNPIAGKRVAFFLASENGRLKPLRGGETDSTGVAEAEYRAGTMIGSVTILASVSDLGVTANTDIILTADAPAKLFLVAADERMPADGTTATQLSVRVTDINDNPNAQVPVTFELLQGSGNVSDDEILTDRNGEGNVEFTAGRRSGTAIIEARHTSRAPTEDELRRIQGTIFVPRLLERQERERVKIREWLVEPGDEVLKGDVLLVLETRRDSWALKAEYDGIFTRKVRFRRDVVEVGETLGYVELTEDAWEALLP